RLPPRSTLFPYTTLFRSGPEAPLMAIGSAVGGFVAMRSADPVRKVLMLAGAVAAITMILGNPMVSAVLVLEAAALKGSPGGKKRSEEHTSELQSRENLVC